MTSLNVLLWSLHGGNDHPLSGYSGTCRNSKRVFSEYKPEE